MFPSSWGGGKSAKLGGLEGWWSVGDGIKVVSRAGQQRTGNDYDHICDIPILDDSLGKSIRRPD
jgi:hypothetical protein